MIEIGRALKQARTEAHLTLEEVSTRTMIAKKYLVALEEGHFTVFPGEVYLKGALRRYARELGLDADSLIAAYDRSFANEETKKTAPPAQVKITASKEKPNVKLPGKKRLRVNKKRLAAFLLIIALAVLGVYGAAALLRNQAQPDPQEPPAIEEPVEEPPVEEPEPPQPEVKPIRVERDSRTDIVRFNVYNAESMEVLFTFVDRCWVRVEADGGLQFEEIIPRNDARTVSAKERIFARIGNPMGFKLVINGQEVQLPETRNPYNMEIVNAGQE